MLKLTHLQVQIDIFDSMTVLFEGRSGEYRGLTLLASGKVKNMLYIKRHQYYVDLARRRLMSTTCLWKGGRGIRKKRHINTFFYKTYYHFDPSPLFQILI